MRLQGKCELVSIFKNCGEARPTGYGTYGHFALSSLADARGPGDAQLEPEMQSGCDRLAFWGVSPSVAAVVARGKRSESEAAIRM